MEVSSNPSLTFREIFAEFFALLMYSFFEGFGILMGVNSLVNQFGLSFLVSGIFIILFWMKRGVASCHFNPVITVAILLEKKIAVTKAGIYMLAQILGSYVGALLLLFFVPTNFEEMAEAGNAIVGCPHLNDNFSPVAGMIVELFGGLVLTIVYLTIFTTPEYSTYTPCIGSVYGMFKISAGIVTGAAIDPFRYLGPALVALNLSDFYVYLFPPFLGGVLGVFLFRFLIKGNQVEDDDEDAESKMDLVENDEIEVEEEKIKAD
jgi:glycerol uptake facilitator-like aquaporin